MPTSRRFRARRGGSARQRTTWQNNTFEFDLPLIGTILFADLTPEPLRSADPRHGTAVCKRLIMSFDLSQDAIVAGFQQLIGLGVYVLTQEGIQQASIEDPLGLDGSRQDWYYWTSKATFRESEASPSNIHWEADIRTSRRLRSGYGLVMAARADTPNVVDMLLTASIRSLWAIEN